MIPKSDKKTALKRRHLSQAVISRLKCPPEKARIHVYDDAAPGLAVRVYPNGRKVFVWIGKVLGKTAMKVLAPVDCLALPTARKKPWNFP